MIASDFLSAAAAAFATALLLNLASACRLHAGAAPRRIGQQVGAGGLALAALALWWPAHLSPAVSLVARAGWVTPEVAQLSPLLLAAMAWLAVGAWHKKQWAGAAGATLGAVVAAWVTLEADPPGTPALPLLTPAVLAPLLVASLLPALGLQGTGRTQGIARGVTSVLAASVAALGAWRSSAGALGAASTAADWVLLAGLTGLAAVLVQVLRNGGEHVEAATLTAPRNRLASIDGITGLPLRGHFEARLAKAMRECHAAGKTLAVMQINLDGFRAINESHGLQTGDLVLEHLGQRLRRAARNGDAVARLSGNDFLMLTTEVRDAEDAERYAVKLLEALAGPYRLEGVEVKVSCSMGVALWPGPSRATRLIGSAELAMREARRLGGARHCIYTPALEANGSPEAELLHDLRNAIASNAFELHFQPKIDAHSGKITGAEALLRWQHPVRGMVGPDEFVPLAERSGLIGPLGDWVIEESCRQSRVWRDAGLRMRVAINLSAFQMQQENIVQRIGEALQRHRVHPSLITCEITETAAMQDTRMTQETFRQLGAMGVHVSIDDFGTGYSSLAYLRKLPAEELKIDRAFVTDLDHSEDARAVVNAVVQLAHALSLKVVAEGVETARQRDILVDLGCDELQGFLFAKPMPARLLLMWAMSDRSSSKAFKGSLFANTMEAPSRVASRLRAGRHLPVPGAVAEAAEADEELGPLPYSR